MFAALAGLASGCVVYAHPHDDLYAVRPASYPRGVPPPPQQLPPGARTWHAAHWHAGVWHPGHWHHGPCQPEHCGQDALDGAAPVR
jgi:hypothetical protein